ncbi:MAG TPA: efflux RND transporter periplasmic adaptor subunit [Bacteroidota bacterium]|nr:efflux RND transporter periplasmic adaptor subunit [Bacteroidota bacterium]
MANGNKSKKKIIILSAIGGVLILLAALVFLGSKKETITTVQTEKIVKRTITQIVSATGKIQPEVQVKINAEVSGEIIGLPVKEGDRVTKGQLLVRIKPDSYQAEYDRAQAATDMNGANLVKAEADFNRAKGLFDKKLIADADMDVARANYLSAKSNYDQAVSSAKEARETLSKTSIYSPMSGVVSELISELGERVSGSTFTEGTQIMTIADLSSMEARVEVGEDDVVLVSVGDTARIDVDAFPGQKFLGTVTRIANTATTTGTGTQDQVTNFEVRIRLHPPDSVQFRPGMSMTSDIETQTHYNVVSVPIQSVTVRMPKEIVKKDEPTEGTAQFEQKAKKKEEEKIEEVVFVVKDGKAKTVVVKRGLSDDAYVEVTGEKLEGSEVVSGPFKAINRDLENGSTVKVDNKATIRTGSSVVADQK